MRSTTWLMCAASLLAPVLTSPVADSVARSVAVSAAPCEVRPVPFSVPFIFHLFVCQLRSPEGLPLPPRAGNAHAEHADHA